MTAPTSDRAQSEGDRRRTVRFIAGHLMNKRWHAAAECMLEAAHNEANTLITERLGGGERETKDERDALKLIADTLTEVAPGWLIMSDAIRTLAQTAKDATARAEAAEAPRKD